MKHIALRAVDILSDGGECAGPGDDKCGNTSCVQNQCGRQVELGTCEIRIESLSF